VPTIAEAGVPGYAVLGSFGVMAPAGTPANIINLINREIANVVRMPEVAERLLASAATPEFSTPEELNLTLRAEVVKWAKIIDATGVKLD
jgi:tripartite-type tricarboxylate transporter receptor subunit TctC